MSRTITLDKIEGKTVKQHRLKELEGQALIDVLPEINPKFPRDQKVLKAWMSYFRDIDTPFVVKKKAGAIKLWKPLRVVTGSTPKYLSKKIPTEAAE